MEKLSAEEGIKNTKPLTTIEHKQRCIDALLALTKAINTNQSTSQIFSLFTQTLQENFRYSNIFILYKTDEGWFVVENNQNNHLDNLDLVDYLAPFKKITYLEKDETSIGEYDTIVPVFHKNKALAYVMIEGVYNQIVDSLEEELRFLETYTNIAIIAAENKRLHKRQIEQEVEHRELQTAAEIQKALIPQSFPNHPICQFAAEYLPHSEIGGDSFDIIPHPTENAAYISIADVSGKGVSAALLMANFQAILRSAIQYEPTPEMFAKNLNRLVYKITKGERFISLFVGLLHFDHHTIEYINFGHNPPILQTENGAQALDEGSTILGVFDELPFMKMGKVNYGEKALLFCYTDGLTDVADETGRRFETERLREFLEKRKFYEPAQLNKELMERVNEYRGRRRFTDDITILTSLIDHAKQA